MAYSDMNDFLKRYFRQMHVNHMSPDVIARLQDDYKKGTLTEDQLDWISKYFTVVDGKLVRNELPDPTLDSELEQDVQARKLYVEIYKTLAKMKGVSHLYTLKDKDATDFLNRWFNTEKLRDGSPAFSIPQANQQTEGSIKNFLDLLGYGDRSFAPGSPEHTLAEQIKQIIRENTFKDNGTDRVFDDQYAVNDFLQKCKDGKYNSDNKVQDKLLKVASALKNYVLSHYDAEEIETVRALKPLYQDLENISSDNAFDKIEITDANLREFRKNKLPVILQTLYENQNVRTKFKDFDQSKIVIDQLEKYSENKIAWQDPQNDNYIQPKLDDVKTPLQQLEKWAGDTYNDTLKKYEELRGGHLFFGAHAKEICKAIDKEKIKPVDGVKGLLAKKDAIKKRIENKNTASHFDWCTKTMEELSPQIEKSIEGCWKDARQMKCVIQNIILKATDPRTATEDDFEKAKTAMEIMTVMKYGMMTSKVMDAMKKEEFSIFSDGKLSWNKNEGIQFVTKAFDKSVKAAFLGVGYGVTFARNQIMMRNMQFTNENNQSGPLNQRIGELNNKLQNDKSYQERETPRLNREDRINIIRNRRTLADLGDRSHRDYIDDTNIDSKESYRDTLKSQMDSHKRAKDHHKADMDRYQNAHDKFVANNEAINKYTELTTITIPNLNAEVTRLTTDAAAAKHEFEHSATYATVSPEAAQVLANEKYKVWQDLEAKKQQAEDELTNAQTVTEPAMAAERARAQAENADPENIRNNNEFLRAETRYNNAKVRYDAAEARYSALDDKITKFHTATDEITELNTAIDNRNEALRTWDENHRNKVIELENYWNLLQSGKAKTWRLFTSKAQEKLDANKLNIMNDFYAQHGLAA